MVAGNHALAFQAPDALGTGRGRQADFLRQLGNGYTPFTLQNIEDFAIDAVQFAHFTSKGKKTRGGQWKGRHPGMILVIITA